MLGDGAGGRARGLPGLLGGRTPTGRVERGGARSARALVDRPAARGALRRLASDSENTRLDFEILIHLFVLAYAGILNAPEQLDGPWYPAVYALAMLGASFTGPKVAPPGVAFAVLLEAALDFVAFRSTSSARLVSHGALLGLFTFLNLIVLRAEIARIRALSRAKIDSELKKMRDAARSYRLLGAPSTAGERALMPAPGRRGAPPALGRRRDPPGAGVRPEPLCARTLGLRTAILLEPRRERLDAHDPGAVEHRGRPRDRAFQRA